MENCLECTSLSDCTLCDYTRNYTYDPGQQKCICSTVMHGEECMPKCPDGFWADTPNKVCVACQSSCEVCVSLSNCTKCTADYQWVNYACLCKNGTVYNSTLQKCVQGCSFGYYKEPATMSCQPCHI